MALLIDFVLLVLLEKTFFVILLLKYKDIIQRRKSGRNNENRALNTSKVHPYLIGYTASNSVKKEKKRKKCY